MKMKEQYLIHIMQELKSKGCLWKMYIVLGLYYVVHTESNKMVETYSNVFVRDILLK